jgi:hypothetical protein
MIKSDGIDQRLFSGEIGTGDNRKERKIRCESEFDERI